MNTSHFVEQMRRLTREFGEANYSKEKQKLIWQLVSDLRDSDFTAIADLCIGEFRPEFPPKVSHFREFAEQRRSLKFKEETAQAAQNWKGQDQRRNTDKKSPKDLEQIMAPFGSKTAVEALMKTIAKRSNDGRK